MLFHVSRHVALSDGICATILQNGERGVQLFYIISAFTLFYSLDHQSHNRPHSRIAFYLRRFFRIAPLFYVSVALYLFIYGWGPRWALGKDRAVTWQNLTATLLFVNGFHPKWIGSIVPVGWSVTVEMTFYLLVPFLFSVITSFTRALCFTLLSLAGSVAVTQAMLASPWIRETPLWRMFVGHWIVSQIPVFGIGFVLYFILKKLDRPVESLSQGMKVAFGLALLAGFSFMLLIAFTPAPSFLADTLHIPEYLLAAPAFVPLVVGLRIFPTRLLINRATTFLGNISYSLYLMHTACLHYVLMLLGPSNPVDPAPWATFGLVFAATFTTSVVVSFGTFKLIEEPGQRLGKSLLARRDVRFSRASQEAAKTAATPEGIC